MTIAIAVQVPVTLASAVLSDLHDPAAPAAAAAAATAAAEAAVDADPRATAKALHEAAFRHTAMCAFAKTCKTHGALPFLLNADSGNHKYGQLGPHNRTAAAKRARVEQQHTEQSCAAASTNSEPPLNATDTIAPAPG